MADPTHASDHANHDADAYQRGSMTIEEQKATWALVQGLFKWGSLAIAAVLLFLTLAFQHGGSILGGLVAGIILFVIGVFALRSPKKGH